jgi:bleomycin hydrolase
MSSSGALEVNVSPFVGKEVHPGLLEATTVSFLEDPKARLAMNVATRGDTQELLVDRARDLALTHEFSNVVEKEGTATNQKASGRCWIFAALNVARRALMHKYGLSESFELSQTYLFVHDKIERANYFLEQVLETLDEPVEGRLMQHLLTAPLEDGGQWDMIVNLVAKYGMVPKSVYPDTHASGASRRMNWIATNKLRDYAVELRRMAGEGVGEGELRAAKARMLVEVQRIFLVHFGPPPTSFEWSFRAKDGTFHQFTGLTPQGFYKEHVGMDFSNMVSVVHDPRHAPGKLFTVERLGNVIGGTRPRVLYINAEVEDLKALTRQCIDAGEPVWFGSDVGKYGHRKGAKLDPDLMDYTLLYGTDVEMSKAERLRYGGSLMTHAMVITGYDKDPSAEGRTRAWRIQNSWGDSGPAKGYWVMSDRWFDEFTFQIVVDKSRLPAPLAAVLDDDSPDSLPPWDPMGALAAGQEAVV